MTPPPYLGLDIGTKRIGIALCDPLGLLAYPLLTLHRGRPRDDLRSLARLARRHGCSAFIAGLPLHISGESSPMSAKVEKFAEELAELAQLPVHFWDERLTSSEAHQVLYAAGRPRSEHRAVVDQVAAVLILQSFLDARRAPEPSAGAL